MCPQKRSLLESIGSGVTHLRELSWETAGFEQQVRDTFTNLSTRMTNLVGPASTQAKEFSRERPITAVLIAAFVTACAFPILVFLSFALITFSIGLIGFLCIEGTILSFGLLILGSCLLTISFIGLSIGAGVLAVYLSFTKTRQLINYFLITLLQTNSTSKSTNGTNTVANGKTVHAEDELSSTESDGTDVQPSAHAN